MQGWDEMDNVIKTSYKAFQSVCTHIHFRLLLIRPYQLELHGWSIGSAEFELK